MATHLDSAGLGWEWVANAYPISRVGIGELFAGGPGGGVSGDRQLRSHLMIRSGPFRQGSLVASDGFADGTHQARQKGDAQPLLVSQQTTVLQSRGPEVTGQAVD